LKKRKEVMRMDKINKIPVFEVKKLYVEGEAQRDFVAIVEERKRQAISVVSTKYSLVQSRDLFRQILQAFGDNVEYEVYYRRGRAEIHIFPAGEDVGISVVNSVDTSTAVRIHFILRTNGTVVYAPVEEFHRLHVGNAFQATVNASEILVKARETWEAIVQKLSATPLTPDFLKEVREAVEEKYLQETVDSFANNHHLAPPTAWSLVLALIKQVAGRNYRSEVNRLARLKEISYLLLGLALKET
jgi:hypothetical protein